MSARSSRAPRREHGEARARDLRGALEVEDAERGAESQCAFGAKSNVGGVPHVWTTTLSASSVPSGTDACGTFGSVSSMVGELARPAPSGILRRKEWRRRVPCERSCSSGGVLLRAASGRPPSRRRAFFSARAASILVMSLAALDVDRLPVLERAAAAGCGRGTGRGSRSRFLSTESLWKSWSPAFCRARRTPPCKRPRYHRSRLSVPRVLVAIVSWNSAAHLAAAVKSVPPGVPVVVVDNASSRRIRGRRASARARA